MITHRPGVNQVAPVPADPADPLDTLEEIARWVVASAEALREALHATIHDLPPTLACELAPELVTIRNRVVLLQDRVTGRAELARSIAELVQ